MFTQRKRTLALILCFVFFFILPSLARAGRSCNYDSDCTGWGEICWDYGGSTSDCVMGKCCKNTSGCTSDADCQGRSCLPATVRDPSHCGATHVAPRDLSVPSGGTCSRTIECQADLACVAGTCGLCSNDSDCYGKSPACVDGHCSAPAGLSCTSNEDCERAFPGQGYICSQNICTQVAPPPTEPALPEYYKLTTPTLQIPIPGLLTNFSPAEIYGEPGERYFYIPWVGEYATAIYKYTLGVVGALATVVMIWAGIIWLTAAGSAERIQLAKEYISGAIIGLVLAFGSYLILYTLNPDLVKFEAMKIKLIERMPWSVQIAEGAGGFDADTYPDIAPSLQTISGDSPAAKAAALCKPDPGNYEARIANLRAILPQWLAICKQNGCAYFKGGFTEGCKTSPGGKRMARTMFCVLKKNNLPLPPGCENYIAECPNGSDADSPSSCWEPLAQYYHDYAAVPVCNAGLIIGDCLSWSHQLLNCAAKTKHRIPEYRAGGLPPSEYLVYGANGIDAALQEINNKGGLKFGDLIWSNAFGHNFMYADGEIVEMGGFGTETVQVPGIGSFGTVKKHPFDWYIQNVRNKERNNSDIKTFIFRPYDY